VQRGRMDWDVKSVVRRKENKDEEIILRK